MTCRLLQINCRHASYGRSPEILLQKLKNEAAIQSHIYSKSLIWKHPYNEVHKPHFPSSVPSSTRTPVDENRIEYTPESSHCISSQLGKFLYCLDFGMILQDKVMEGISILGKRMYQHGKLIVGVIISKNESKFFSFETKHFPANFLLGQIGLGTFQKELQFGSNGQRTEYQWR